MSEEVNPVVPGEVPPAPGTAEYNTMMTARGNAHTSTDSIPDKFKNADGTVNAEMLAQSYVELEKMHSKAAAASATVEEAAAEPVPPAPEKLQVEDPPPAPEVVKADVKTGISEEKWGSWKGEIMRDGDVSAESRKELQALGFNDNIIKDFVSAHKSHLRQGMQKAAGVVGGEDSLSKIFGWASNNLDEGARAQINSGLAGPAWEVTLRGLEAQYSRSLSEKPMASEMTHRTKVSNPAGKQTQKGFGSMAEFSAERANAKYGRDAQYTENVNRRAGMTDWSQIR